MATYKQICEAAFEEINGRPLELTTVNLGKDTAGTYYVTDPTQRNMIRWVADANLRVQQETPYWKFLHKRGEFLTTKADKDEYTKKYVRALWPDSIYAIKQGSAGRTPVLLDWTYEDWLRYQRSTTGTSGSPLRLIKKPEETWLVHPAPTGIWTIYADWWIYPLQLEEDCDEPPWDADYHDILKWMALHQFAAEFDKEGVGAQLRARINYNLKSRMEAFRLRYWPSLTGPGPLF